MLRRVRRASLGVVAVAAVYVLFLRRPILTWGATDEEATARLPGDELLEDADGIATRAIEIDAPPAAVWPWIAQIGPSPRGGAYTYDWIENLLGLDMHSADRVLPDFQHPEVGDTIGSARIACGSSGWSPSTFSPGALRMETGSGRSSWRIATARRG